MRRILGIALAIVLIGGVAAAVIAGRGGQGSDGTATKTVRGVIGSEKSEFFTDPEVVKALADKGFTVQTETSGSWAMDRLPLKEYDFAFPGSSEPARRILAKAAPKGAQPARPFYSPLVVVTRSAAAKVLADNGLAQLKGAHTGRLRMGAYLKAAAEDRTWQQLKGSAGHPELTGTVFVKTTDPNTSNSGALWLSATSFVANGTKTVADEAAIAANAPLMRKLYAVQGALAQSTDEPFRDFISGAGDPLILVYESQIAALLLQQQDPGDLVVLYPDTTVNSDHTLVPFNDDARALGDLLANDKRLRQLAVRHGFRPQGARAEFAAATAQHTGYLARELSGIRQVSAPTLPVLQALARRATGTN
ncbi:substrate-binding domain-containing protein [Streptomyces bambusae]|uniref:substrate-binding domain-containing protein n=1 Tax=Streptomyces bambusae TaxID=1550616 RepID=UPI001CFCC0EC|nr:substrate-binding domain-containing protein [Streptomyces bambusae]MCB5168154.1 substrate-binding domain-containing protein [Streptomyces bambusae]